MQTLIFGSRGQLGRDLVNLFRDVGETLGLDLPEMDITEKNAVERAVADFEPDLVINAAAYTDVERAESDEQTAFRVNETGAGHVAAAAASAGAPVVYYSTDFVFAGAKTAPYEPDDPVAPLGVYGRSKAAGEAATRAANPRHFIVRTAWLYGVGGNNFVEKILSAAASKPALKVVADEIGSPTYTRHLAQATQALCRTGAYGAYHAVNAGACSRFEFARTILEFAGLDTPVQPCRAADYPTQVKRPAYSVLSLEKLERVCGCSMPPWQTGLREYLEQRETRS